MLSCDAALKTSGTCASYIGSAEDCERAADKLGLSDTTAQVLSSSSSSYPRGCFLIGSSILYYNPYSSSSRECSSSYQCLCGRLAAGKLSITGVPDAQGVLPVISGNQQRRLFAVGSNEELTLRNVHLAVPL